MNHLDTFCRAVRERSAGNRRAVASLAQADLPEQILSILRQELDSMVRVIYLLSQSNAEYREQLLVAFGGDSRWTRDGNGSRVTDKEMVELSQCLHGWTASVYRFGCGFIHLSLLHDRRRDGFLALSEAERSDIVEHLRVYHGGLNTPAPTFADLAPFFPRVFEKIAGNLECYLKTLEAGGSLDESAA